MESVPNNDLNRPILNRDFYMSEPDRSGHFPNRTDCRPSQKSKCNVIMSVLIFRSLKWASGFSFGSAFHMAARSQMRLFDPRLRNPQLCDPQLRDPQLREP